MLFMAGEGSNPLIPSVWTFGVHGIVVVAVALVITALVSIERSRRSSGTAEPLWVLIVLLFPVIGSVLWFGIGRRRRLRDPRVHPRDVPARTTSGR